MALVNHAKREINAKIVVCGPPSAGKATLLKSICSQLPAEDRGPLRSMTLQNDKMLFFDFTHPPGGDPDSYSVRFHVYTLTGAVAHENSWKMVLKGVDGIAFVADADMARQSANRQAMNQLRGALVSHGKSMDDLATVALCAKCDLPGAVPVHEVRDHLDIDPLPLVPVSPLSGEGALDALGRVVAGIVADLKKLDLSLQKPVATFLNRGAEAVEEAQERSPEPPAGDIALPTDSSPATEDEQGRPSLSVAGPPEIDPSGAIRIPVKIGCCGAETIVHLSISLVAD